MTDLELAKGCLEGKRAHQRALYGQYAKTMMSVCLRYTDSRDDALDVMQEAFIKVFERIGQWQGTGPLGGWIRMIMVNTALTHYRSQNKWAHMKDADELTNEPSSTAGALDQISSDELMQLIATMPAGYRTVFNLFAVEGFGHKEIGEMLGISENTSKTQFLKARNWLQKAILKEEIRREYQAK